jgi:protein-disulfide isomerase
MPEMRRYAVSAWLLAGIMLSASAPATSADEPTALSVEQVEKIVREYLLREPQVVYEALQELQRRQAEATAARQRAAIVENRSELLNDPASPVGGDPDGDVTLVEFFDYRCAYCRRVVSSMRALLDEDRDLRVVFKELPVLGPDSERAARGGAATCPSTSRRWPPKTCRSRESAPRPKPWASTPTSSRRT